MLGSAFVLDADEAKSYAGVRERKWGSRPARYQKRISSWSDVKSAWDDEGFWMTADTGGRKKNKEAEDIIGEKRMGNSSGNSGEVEGGKNTSKAEVVRRYALNFPFENTYAYIAYRRSFHDIGSLRSMRILSPERMKIDVELCGQLLMMMRREEHLRNIIVCVEV